MKGKEIRMHPRFIPIISMVFLIISCTSVKTGRTPEGSIRKGAPVVYIHPVANIYQGATVGILPFIMPNNFPQTKGEGVAEIFKDILLGKRAFTRIIRLKEDYHTATEAIEIGRRNKVDLVLAGQVNYALTGTDVGGSMVDISVRLLNVDSENTVWYVEQTMEDPLRCPKTDFFSRIKGSVSPPPILQPDSSQLVPNMVAKIAMDMADVFAGAQEVAQ